MTEPESGAEVHGGSPDPRAFSVKRIAVVTLIAAIVLAAAGWFLMPLYYDRQNQQEVDALDAWLHGDGPPPKGKNFLYTQQEMEQIRQDYYRDQQQK